MRMYSLRKSRHVLRHAYHRFLKMKKKMPSESRAQLQSKLLALQDEILRKNREKADEMARQVESLSATVMRRSGFDQIKDLVLALGFALIVAVVVRQMWFEFYEIPSGSMRPTLKEHDRLAVSKTTFGVNIPLTPAEFYFDNNLVQRSGICIFTGENMDIHDVKTMYFYVFPGYKQYVKRMIGKPGDTVYFYGGQIYGIDESGKDISPEWQRKELERIDHIPFIHFDRNLVLPPQPANGIYSPVYIYQMNEPVAKLSLTPTNQVQGEMVVPTPFRASGSPQLSDYGQLWGFDNYGMARLLTRSQVKNLTDQNPAAMEDGVLYLEIRHHPSFENARLIRDEMGRLRPSIGISTSMLPLQEEHLKALFHNMYTARFVVKNGSAYRYGLDSKAAMANIFLPKFDDVPDGTYEFYYGKAYKVQWQGITTELPPEHPLCRYSPEVVQLLFNVGMEWDTRFAPQVKNQRLSPARYTYFRDGDLYLLGAPILKKGDTSLEQFLTRELARKDAAYAAYKPFADAGAPLKSDGTLDVEFIRARGMAIPPKSYLVLGDNHAMSADSREFGMVPQSNLRGAPDVIFWPPGSRWGFPNQPAYPFMNLPRGIVWVLGAIGFGLGYMHWRRRNALPLKFENGVAKKDA